MMPKKLSDLINTISKVNSTAVDNPNKKGLLTFLKAHTNYGNIPEPKRKDYDADYKYLYRTKQLYDYYDSLCTTSKKIFKSLEGDKQLTVVNTWDNEGPYNDVTTTFVNDTIGKGTLGWILLLPKEETITFIKYFPNPAPYANLNTSLRPHFENLHNSLAKLYKYAKKIQKKDDINNANFLIKLADTLWDEITKNIEENKLDKSSLVDLYQRCEVEISKVGYKYQQPGIITNILGNILKILGALLIIPVILEYNFRDDGLTFFSFKDEKEQLTDNFTKNLLKLQNVG